MKRIYALIPLILLLSGCSRVNSRLARSPEANFEPIEVINNLPSYNEDLDEIWQVDLRGKDLSSLDLRNEYENLTYADFDTRTIWPSKMPENYRPDKLLELGKNPGFNIRTLDKKYNGENIGIGIIDQPLLIDHVEYKDNLKLYEEVNIEEGAKASMHGGAVASISVGKTCGIASGADLYYIAEKHSYIDEQGIFKIDFNTVAKSIERLIEINKGLSKDKKIRVISISLGLVEEFEGYEEIKSVINKAEKDNIHVVYIERNKLLGLGRLPNDNPNDFNSYIRGDFWKNNDYSNDHLLFPMDSRTVASPTGLEDYAFYRFGGNSWVMPYVAGLCAVSCQVDSNMTPDRFYRELEETANVSDSNLSKIIDPLAFIKKIEN